MGEHSRAAREVVKAAQSTTSSAAQVRKAPRPSRRPARARIVEAVDGMRRGRTSTARALAEQATASEQISKEADRLAQLAAQVSPLDGRAGLRLRTQIGKSSEGLRHSIEPRPRKRLQDQSRAVARTHCRHRRTFPSRSSLHFGRQSRAFERRPRPCSRSGGRRPRLLAASSQPGPAPGKGRSLIPCPSARAGRCTVAPGVPLLSARSAPRTDSASISRPAQCDLMLEKLRDRVLAHNGCASYLDYFYILKYAEHGLGRMAADRRLALLRSGNLFLARDRPDPGAGRLSSIRRGSPAKTRPLRVWSAAVRHRRGADQHRHGPGAKPAGDGTHRNSGQRRAARPRSPRRHAGVYRERSFRSLPSELRMRLFRTATSGRRSRLRQVPAPAHRLPARQSGGLPEEISGLAATADVVFCRNVFIYFSPDGIRAHGRPRSPPAMPTGGRLFVGAAGVACSGSPTTSPWESLATRSSTSACPAQPRSDPCRRPLDVLIVDDSAFVRKSRARNALVPTRASKWSARPATARKGLRAWSKS